MHPVHIIPLSIQASRKWHRGEGKVTIKHHPGSNHVIHVSKLQHELIMKAHKKGSGCRIENEYPQHEHTHKHHHEHRHLEHHHGGEVEHYPPPLPIHSHTHHVYSGGSTWEERLARRTRNTFEPVKKFFVNHGEELALEGAKSAINTIVPIGIKALAGGAGVAQKRKRHTKGHTKGGALIAAGYGVEHEKEHMHHPVRRLKF